jgi:hypothetical protein
MPRIPGTTNAQSAFLRAFRDKTRAAIDWPAPAVVRRWLRRPAFVAALDSLRAACQYEVDFNLATAATCASQLLAIDPAADDVKRLAELLRLAHLRHRFPAAHDAPLKSPATFALRQQIRDLEKKIADLDEAERLANDPHARPSFVYDRRSLLAEIARLKGASPDHPPSHPA